MEITLEKIELVKDRTGVSYKEAKEALEAADGSVVDAIINIEEEIDEKGKNKFTGYAGTVIDKLKEIIKKGNVSRIIVRKDGEIILNLPLNVGIIGTVISPLAAVAGVIAAFGTKCDIEVVKEDGTVIDVNEMASGAKEDLAQKGSGIAEELKVRGAELYDVVKEKSVDAYEAVKEKAADVIKREDKCSCGCDDDVCGCGCDCEDGECSCGCDDECACEEKADGISIEIEIGNTCEGCEADDCENCK